MLDICLPGAEEENLGGGRIALHIKGENDFLSFLGREVKLSKNRRLGRDYNGSSRGGRGDLNPPFSGTAYVSFRYVILQEMDLDKPTRHGK